ncbi:MAG: hypothetical protein ACTSXL_05680 [Alphaproteobacteria bacterium]
MKKIKLLLLMFFIGFAPSVFAQHHSSSYYRSGWQSAYTPSSRVATVPSYGKRVAKRQKTQMKVARQRQRSQAFDTLAETGLYFGLSLGKGQVAGKMTSTNCDPKVPGNCSDGDSEAMDSTSMGISFGVAMTSTTRLELTYTRLADMKYGETASHNDGFGNRTLNVQGGDIESNLLMANFFYSLEDMFGNFSGGKLIPYFGFGLGLSFNTVKEYTISDKDGYFDESTCFTEPAYEYNSTSGQWDLLPNGLCDEFYDGEATYAGDTTQNIAWGFELGITYKMQNRMFLDFFFKHTNLGEISSSGMVVNDYFFDHYFLTGETIPGDTTSSWAIDNGGAEGIDDGDATIDIEAEQQMIEAFYDAVEKDDFTVTELGVKLRIMF